MPIPLSGGIATAIAWAYVLVGLGHVAYLLDRLAYGATPRQRRSLPRDRVEKIDDSSEEMRSRINDWPPTAVILLVLFALVVVMWPVPLIIKSRRT